MTAAIRTQHGAEFARIMSVGVHRPDRVVTNAEISAWVGRGSFFGGIAPELTCSMSSAQ